MLPLQSPLLCLSFRTRTATKLDRIANARANVSPSPLGEGRGEGKSAPSPLGEGRGEGQSDCICSALQFINFWQDVALDWAKGRVYLPQEDLARFGVSERSIAEGVADERWRALLAFECARARSMLLEGSPLGFTLPGRLGLEIRATVEGGLAILDKIGAARADVFRHRPVLGKPDWARMVVRAALRKAPR
jgi:phytoene/squalene synthetase